MCRYFSNGSGFHPGFMLHCGVIGTTPWPWEARLELMYGRWPGGGAASGGESANSLHASRPQLPIQALSYKTTAWAVQKCHSGRIQNRSGIQCGDKAAVWEGLTLQWRKRKGGGGGSVNDDLGQCPQRDDYILSYHTSCWLWTDLDLITFFHHS